MTKLFFILVIFLLNTLSDAKYRPNLITKSMAMLGTILTTVYFYQEKEASSHRIKFKDDTLYMPNSEDLKRIVDLEAVDYIAEKTKLFEKLSKKSMSVSDFITLVDNCFDEHLKYSTEGKNKKDFNIRQAILSDLVQLFYLKLLKNNPEALAELKKIRYVQHDLVKDNVK